jgi:hypothetical protein
VKTVCVVVEFGSATFQAPLDDVRVAFNQPWLEVGGEFRRLGGDCRYVEGGVVRWSADKALVTEKAREEATLQFVRGVGEAFREYNRRVLALYGLTEREIFGQIAGGRSGGHALDRLYSALTSYPIGKPARTSLIKRLL